MTLNPNKQTKWLPFFKTSYSWLSIYRQILDLDENGSMFNFMYHYLL